MANVWKYAVTLPEPTTRRHFFSVIQKWCFSKVYTKPRYDLSLMIKYDNSLNITRGNIQLNHTVYNSQEEEIMNFLEKEDELYSETNFLHTLLSFISLMHVLCKSKYISVLVIPNTFQYLC